jgi:hypothetical protein
MFKVGDKVKLEDLPLVEVRDDESEEWMQAYFLAKVDGLDYPIIVVVSDGCTFGFKQIRSIQEEVEG